MNDPNDLIYKPWINEPMGNSSGVPEGNTWRCVYSEREILKAAQEAYEINRAYELASWNPRVCWEDSPAWSKTSAAESVKSIIKNPYLTSEELHLAWVNHKLETGWVWGESYSIDLGTHPCLLPYNELSPQNKIKLILFGGTVRRMLEMT